MKTRKLSVFSVLSAAIQLALLPPAFAGLPGETYDPQNDHVGGSDLQCQGTYSEARNGGHLILVWRGWLENTNSGASPVWMSLDNGTPFTIGVTETFVSPQVVPWGPDAFLVFHTGVDGNIWFTPVYANGSNSGTWYNVPGNTTNMPVSVAQMGNGSYNVYMVYRGVGNDPRVWGTWFGGPNGWSTPENIGGGMANSAPAVVMNNVSNQLFVTAQGTDNKLWITHQTLGAIGWNGWTPQNSWNPYGTDTFDTAHMAVTSDGNMVISVWNGNSQPEYAVYDLWGNQQTAWSTDPSKTVAGVQLTAVGNVVYALMNLNDIDGYYEQIYVAP